jgi:hypothetical protein
VCFYTNGRIFRLKILRYTATRCTIEVKVESEEEFASVGVDNAFVDAHLDGDVGHLAENVHPHPTVPSGEAFFQPHLSQSLPKCLLSIKHAENRRKTVSQRLRYVL